MMLQKQEEAIAKKSMAMEVINTVLEAVYNSQLVDVSKIVHSRMSTNMLSSVSIKNDEILLYVVFFFCWLWVIFFPRKFSELTLSEIPPPKKKKKIDNGLTLSESESLK